MPFAPRFFLFGRSLSILIICHVSQTALCQFFPVHAAHYTPFRPFRQHQFHDFATKMRERLQNVQDRAFIGTIHSFCMEMLRNKGYLIAYFDKKKGL